MGDVERQCFKRVALAMEVRWSGVAAGGTGAPQIREGETKKDGMIDYGPQLRFVMVRVNRVDGVERGGGERWSKIE